MTSNHRSLDDTDVQLIERIKLSPCLYDTHNPDFRLVQAKEYQWQKVAETVSMSTDDCRKRWTILRDRYARDLKKLQLNPQNSGLGKNEFFRRMDFLRSFVKKRRVRKKIGNLKTELPMQIVKIDYTTYDIETIKVQSQTEESSQEESELKYVYIKQPREDTPLDEECEKYQQYVDDTKPAVINGNPETCNNESSMNAMQNASQIEPPNVPAKKITPSRESEVNAESEELFSRVIASYLKNLSRRYKIKAKVEMMQILEKYIDLEEKERQA